MKGGAPSGCRYAWCVHAFACAIAAIAWVTVPPAWAVAFLPVSDATLRARAAAIVHGVVLSTRVVADALGRPERVAIIRPIEVLKGSVPGDLVLHQLGGKLPDGRALELGGSPDYTPGTQVLVFAIARPEGDYQTAEMLLGKFEIFRDRSGRLFAVPALAGTDAWRAVEFHRPSSGSPAGKADFGPPRALVAFAHFLRDPSARGVVGPAPVGKLQLVRDATIPPAPALKWALLGSGWRWNNGATASWVLDGSANVTGGGRTEAANAIAAWTNEPNSQIAYTLGTDPAANPIHLSAPTSPCGWSSCIDASGGVIGCGGPSGGGDSNVWRGETYNTITAGEVWLRPYCTTNVFPSSETQGVLEHELGHTLGLAHSDQGMSPHDACIGDEDEAIMASVSQGASSLGSDDIDAVRWLYGDGANSCSVRMLSVSVGTAMRGSVTSNPAGIACPGTCAAGFASGTVVTLTAVPATGYVFAGWSGDASGTATSVQVTMSAARDVVASFDDPSHPEAFPPGCTLPTAGWVNAPPGATTGWHVTNAASSEGACSLQSNAMSSGPAINAAQIRFAGTFTPGNVTFDRRVSSESGYDCLRFLIDGVAQQLQGGCSGAGGLGASGEVPWGPVSVPITGGLHTLTWSYEKDETVSNGSDAAWIDRLVLPLAGLALSPASMLDLGDASIGGQSSLRTITVANHASASIAIASIAATGDFTITDDCGSSIPPAGSCNVSVVLAPTQTGPRQGILTIHTTSAGDFHVDLSGYGEKAMPAAASAILLPVVAHTGSFSAEVYVHNGNATPITLDVDFHEADNSSIPGARPCSAFAVPASTTRLFTLTDNCALGDGPHFGMLALQESTGAHVFTAFARTQTPAGVGFTVDGRPIASFGSGPAFVDGLKRSSTGPQYLSNCFVGALGAQVDYRLDLSTSDGVPIGRPLVGSLAAHHMLRYLDVLAAAGAPAGDYEGVRAKFTETTAGNAPLVAFCTMQESVTFSADFRIAKADDMAAPAVVVPVVARTTSYTTEVYVRNTGAATVTLGIVFHEGDNSAQPGARTCAALSIPAGATRLLSLASQCGLDTAPHFGMLVLEDAASPRSHPFTVFSRSQTPAGVGFSVEGVPAGAFRGGTAFVEGLRRSSSGPHYLSNCFVGALDASVAYRIDLASVAGAPIGTTLAGTLAPHHMLRYLDVLAAANAPAGDYAQVTAKFSETGTSAPFVAFCTMQESITFGADFRIAN